MLEPGNNNNDDNQEAGGRGAAVAAVVDLRRRRRGGGDAGLMRHQQQPPQLLRAPRRLRPPAANHNNNININAAQSNNPIAPHRRSTTTVTTSATARKFSRWYCWASAVGAALAILTAANPTALTVSPIISPTTHHDGGDSSSSTGSSKGTATTATSSSSISPKKIAALSAMDALMEYATTTTTNLENKEVQQYQIGQGAEQQQQQLLNPAAAVDNYASFWDSIFLSGSSNNNNKNERNMQQQQLYPVKDENKQQQQQQPPIWLRWLLKDKDSNTEQPVAVSTFGETNKFPWFLEILSNTNSKSEKSQKNNAADSTTTTTHFWMLDYWLDPNILHPHQDTVTDLIDKVLTSTVRLLLIANWLMALTVLLHTAVADWFLGSDTDTAAGNSGNNNNEEGNDNSRRRAGRFRARGGGVPPAVVAPLPPLDQQQWTSGSSNSSISSSRERMGGFLVFKLLLISAVVAPDTLDLLILLSWYTVLSFLRSLAALCAQQTDIARALSSSSVGGGAAQTTMTTTPSPGVWKLLVTVLCMDLMAATVCVALFHGAGLGMVLLLTCDCALLAVDVITNILQYLQLVWEVQHAERIVFLEDEQLELHQERQQQQQQHQELQLDTNISNEIMRGNALGDRRTTEEMSRELDRQMELMEQQHARKMSFLESAIFGLQLLTDLLTVAHFVHIWTLHGVQFTLIDGVLALHLHSALSSASKKIAERRNLYRIARDMNGMFEDASELDLRKAAASGDVCCICLGTMSYFPNGSNSNTNSNVKKIACGHLYHTACLREVVERARSIEAAKCPLCRSYVVLSNGRQNDRERTRRDGIANGTQARAGAGDPGAAVAGLGDDGDFAAAFQDPNGENNRDPNVIGRNDDIATIAGAGEHALFRFSTEGMFPAWIPLPAFSFEVVRRPPMTAAAVDGEANAARDVDTDIGTFAANDTANNRNANDNERLDAAPQNQQQSLLRRLLVLAGAIPMSPEEERAALDQLVDMFPQYDRQDLLRALRERGSSDAVVESILLGVFIGVPRGIGAR